MDYAKEHGNRTAARVFGLPPTEKMVRAWRQHKDKLKTANKSKHNLRCPHPQWPELEDDVKKWVVDERSSGRRVSTKMILKIMRLGELQKNEGYRTLWKQKVGVTGL